MFEGADGRRTIDELFDGRGQLVIYHAMFNPDTASESTTWTKDAPCFACSFWMDNFNDVVIHLNHRDVTMASVSLAPYAKLAPFRQRLGWRFPVYSSAVLDFNFDYHVSFTPEQMKACIAMCRCRELLDSGALRAALAEGMTYGLSCVACSAGVMVGLVVVGMSNVVWMVAGSALILLYKIAGRWPRRLDSGLSVALVVAGTLAISRSSSR